MRQWKPWRAISTGPQRGAEIACGSKEFWTPFPVSPKGQAGAGGFPPRRKHAARQQKALARIAAAGSPHKRAAAPLCIPRERGSGGLGRSGEPYISRKDMSRNVPAFLRKLIFRESFTQNT